MTGPGAESPAGRQVLVEGNMIFRCGLARDGSPERNSGIWIADANNAATTNHSVIRDYLIQSEDGSMEYVVFSEVEDDNLVIENNGLFGCGTTGVSDSLAGNHWIKRNDGFKTERSGSARFMPFVIFPSDSARDYVEIDHCLDIVPDAEKFQVPPDQMSQVETSGSAT